MSSAERVVLDRLGQTVRLARLRRNLSQAELAARMGVARSSVASLECGGAGIGMGVLLKALTVMGYGERLGDILASDPVGDDLDVAMGRRRAGRPSGVEAF